MLRRSSGNRATEMDAASFASSSSVDTPRSEGDAKSKDALLRGAAPSSAGGPAEPRKPSGLLERLGLYEVPADADGLYHGLISPPAQARYMFGLAWLSFISGIVAVSRGHYDLCPVPFGVWLTSMLFWWKPTYCWRRWVDIGYVQVALGYQMWRAASGENRVAYYSLTGAAVLCYPMGHYYHGKGLTWAGTLWHSGIHILANIGNVVLYAGAVKKLSE